VQSFMEPSTDGATVTAAERNLHATLARSVDGENGNFDAWNVDTAALLADAAGRGQLLQPGVGEDWCLFIIILKHS
jgi:hypothetical protein